MSSLKYPTITRIPNEEDNFQCTEPLLPGSEVLVILEDDGTEMEIIPPNGARHYKLHAIGAAVTGKFYDHRFFPIPDSDFSF